MVRSKRKRLLILLAGLVAAVSITALAIRPKHYYYGRILSYEELMQWSEEGRPLGCVQLPGTLFDYACFDTEQEAQDYANSLS